MWDYTDKVLDLFYNPKNQGAIAPCEEPGIAVVFGEVGSIACGDALRLHLQIDIASDKILDARFQTFGCTSAIASSSALTELIKGLTLDAALHVTNKEIADYLGGLPEAKMHCSVMGQEALEAAIYKYRGIEIEHHEEDEGALICACYGVSENKIRRVAIENNLTTVEQVTSYVKAGGGCSSCAAAIEDVLTDLYKEAKTLAAEIALREAIPQPPLTIVQKITLIQRVLDEEVRPVLMADGGDVELYDVEGNTVKVVLKGACGSCSSSTATLKIAVEARLQERVLPTLVVEAI
ncbi:Fe-S cluster assembly protein NifU [Desertifilum sp. FACHB-1129]|uniref:Nitrogen fixation protein NifU n=1 Tax=Desertifilum tharense IPPAS B-1220 TaxID=1781255 RepID=A0A1E5QEV9_9CYAN|nr:MULTISPECIES: Fe-S cluster assembly protein NifU [Desertifilum]MDA0212685.1 Fe-S cluster assembly protein NifU [Cyanobacteria bacterium FC1]MBD2313085.1 Fe-S cluster assembly protein NifU [Desertifilum sp. FACHB-1129]MBD2324109.1 Fe-S cluster assembly protein NifU [Desertifilum sp. FACHB-866]MBD2334044.1 Fe-S cluster assembly protein NifU [Desertifilum sp. FACHB-868]OEJ73131.1 Fe-S cluster assembly protein NifU [Desertifilum tharense IPPAS B-1220]